MMGARTADGPQSCDQGLPRGAPCPDLASNRRRSMPVYTAVDQFTNLVVISQRSNSRVVRAHCRATGQEVALKCFQKSALSPKEAVHVAREVHLLSSLRGDPGVVQIAGFFEDESHCYIVMEHCAGRDLYYRLISDMYFNEEFVCKQVLTPLLNTLDRLHAHHHIVHRDIKPENLLLTANGELRLADFGTAIKQDVEVPFLPVGTLDFMAPEVLGSPAPKGAVESPCTTMAMLLEHNLQGYDEKADIWSVGALAYELIVGETPFYHKEPAETRKLILGSAYLYFPRPLKHTPFADFVRATLAKDPARRPSAAALLQHEWLRRHRTAPHLQHSASALPAVGAKDLSAFAHLTMDVHVDATGRVAPPLNEAHLPQGLSGSSSGESLCHGGDVSSSPSSGSDESLVSCDTVLPGNPVQSHGKQTQRQRAASAPMPPSWTLEKYPHPMNVGLVKAPPGGTVVSGARREPTESPSLALRRITERSSLHERDSTGGGSAPVSRRGSSFFRPAKGGSGSEHLEGFRLGARPSEQSEEGGGMRSGKRGSGQLKRIKSYLRRQRSSWLKSFGGKGAAQGTDSDRSY